MIDQGAELIFFTSDDMKDGAILAAQQNPDVPMIWSSGDNAWAEGLDYRPDLANLGNVMGQMEYGKMIAGCSRRPQDRRPVQHRLRRSAHQRRDPPARELRLPRRALLLGGSSSAMTPRPDVRGQLDRLLVQHPRRDGSTRRSCRTSSSTTARMCSSPASTRPEALVVAGQRAAGR